MVWINFKEFAYIEAKINIKKDFTLLLANERWIHFFDLSLMPFPNDAPRDSFADCIDRIERIYNAGTAVVVNEAMTNAIRITGLEIDREANKVKMLVQYSDLNASDPVFSNLETGKLRVERKLEGEGVAVSAHLVISLNHHDPIGERYHALLEEVPGVSKSRIEPFLRKLISDAYVGVSYNPDDGGNERSYRPMLSMEGLPSETLLESLEQGTLLNFTLIKRIPHQEMDEDGFTEVQRNIVTVKLKRQPASAEDKVNLINRVKGWAAEKEFDQIAVTYKRREGKQTTARLDHEEDAFNALFSRHEPVRLEQHMGQCEEHLHQELCGKMAQMMDELQD